MSRTTAWTVTSRPATATGWPSTGRASRSATAATLTYSDLLAEVCKAANALTDLGVVADDRVAIYMPMVPEAIVAMLACARLGVMHSVVFAGYSAPALRARIEDAQAKLVITTDGQYRRGKAVSLKESVDDGRERRRKPVEHVLVVRRTGIDVPWTEGRDLWWHDTVANASPEHTPEAFDAEHPLFLLYTSGTTGAPKGIMHTTGGYLTQASYTHHNIFDVKPETDVYWCTADIGWVTGHTYIVYGAAVQRGDPGALRGHTLLAERASAFRGDRKVRRHDLLHRADADPHVHEVGPRDPRRPRPVQPAAAGHASAKTSTPRRGGGTGTRSAATEHPSSTPGGRPRPERR